MSLISELHEKIDAGWTFAEARMGKGWQEKYPNIADARCGYGYASSDGSYKIWLETFCRLGSSGFHSISYTLHEVEIASSRENIYGEIDKIIKNYLAAGGNEKIAHLKNTWTDEKTWRTRYSHLSRWIDKGKRCCVSVKINCVTHQSSAKAWLYDKPTDTETVIFERKNASLTEQAILQAANEAIGKWFDEHSDFEYSI